MSLQLCVTTAAMSIKAEPTAQPTAQSQAHSPVAAMSVKEEPAAEPGGVTPAAEPAAMPVEEPPPLDKWAPKQGRQARRALSCTYRTFDELIAQHGVELGTEIFNARYEEGWWEQHAGAIFVLFDIVLRNEPWAAREL